MRTLITLLLLTVASQAYSKPVSLGTWTEQLDLVTHRFYRIFTPSGAQPTRTLIAYHGCNQTIDEFIALTEIEAIASKLGAIALLPVQSAFYNQERCWNWFMALNQSRTMGDALWTNLLLRQVQNQNPALTEEAYVLGFSSGAAMATIYSSCFPKNIKAVALIAGLPFGAASSYEDAQTAIQHGSVISPVKSAELAYNCGGSYGQVARALIMNGDSDKRVNPVNSAQLAEQYLHHFDLADDGKMNASVSFSKKQSRGVTPVKDGLEFLRVDYENQSRQLVRRISVRNMTHAWPGGPVSTPRSEPRAPSAREQILDFFRDGNTQ